MKRTPFRRKAPPPRPAKQISTEYTLRPRPVAVAVCGSARLTVPIPKQPASQCEAYMAAVRSLPCYRCGVAAFSQFAHSDFGKGLALKTDVRLGWPGCGPRMMEAGCHWIVGTSGGMSRDERREFERAASAATRATIRDMGLWPATLPAWAGDELEAS